jgi:DNA-binding NarL/FixJ family response regulator
LRELRILVADDHELVRRGIVSLLEAEAGWKVVGEVGDGQKLLEKAEELKPDIIILDIVMPRLNGLEAARRMKKILPRAKLLILSMHDSEEMARALVEAGASGYVTKADAGRDVVAAVEALRKGRTFFTPRIDEMVLQYFVHKQPAKAKEEPPGLMLSSRQREIVQLLAEGKSSKEVAAVLNLSVKTIETHRANIMKRLNLHSVVELIHYAIRNDIIHVAAQREIAL